MDNDRKKKIPITEEEFKIIEQLRETGTVSNQNILRTDANVTSINDKYKKIKKRYEDALDMISDLESQLQIYDNIKDNRNVYKINRKTSKSSGGTAVMVASDWHIEEKVDPSTVNNRNEYNPEEAVRRANNFFKRGLFLVNLMRNGMTIDRLIFAILGDIINGYIHDEYVEDNYMSPIEAIQFAQDVISSGIDFLIDNGEFSEIIIPCCRGNHGRTTKKRVISTSHKNSFETLLYNNLARIYEGNKKVKFIVNNSYETYVDIYDNYRIRFHHGDSIRYQGGVGGITIPVNKAIAQWNKNIKANLDVFGHWHTQLDVGNFVSNGSLIGWNPFAVHIKASYELPMQQFFVIDQEHGKTIVAPIHVL